MNTWDEKQAVVVRIYDEHDYHCQGYSTQSRICWSQQELNVVISQCKQQQRGYELR